jgi:hypothetical protein
MHEAAAPKFQAFCNDDGAAFFFVCLFLTGVKEPYEPFKNNS